MEQVQEVKAQGQAGAEVVVQVKLQEAQVWVPEASAFVQIVGRKRPMSAAFLVIV
jgi:hypothetical protein